MAYRPCFTLITLLICTGLLSITLHVKAISSVDSTKPSVTAQVTGKNDTLRKDTTKHLLHIKIAKDGVDDDITYTADDTIVYDVINKTVFLYNNAIVKYQDIEVRAYYIAFNYGTGVMTARPQNDSVKRERDKPSFKQGTEAFNAMLIQFNFKTKKGRVSDIITEQGDGFMHGNVVKINEKRESFGKGMIYTTCNNENHPDFYIKASRAKVVPDKIIVTGPAELFVEDVPTPLFLPFGIFPIQKGRRNGILIPTYGESQTLGFYLQNGGYYFGIGDKMDMAIRGSVYSHGSWGLNLASRYVNKYKFSGDYSLSYDRFRTGDPLEPTFSVSNEYRFNWHLTQDPKANPYHTFNISVNAGSSGYDKKFNPDITAKTNNTLNSSISYTKRFDGYIPLNLSLNFNHSQILSTHQVDLTLPSLSLFTDRINFFQNKNKPSRNKWYDKIGTTVSISAANYITFYDTMKIDNHLLKRFRNGLKASAPISTSFQVLKYFTISPSISDNIYGYLTTIRKHWDNTLKQIVIDTLNLPALAADYNFGVSASTRIYGLKQFKKGYIRAIRHVMSPSVSFNYKPDFANSKFGYYRTTQADSAGKTMQTYSIFEQGINGGPAQGKFGGVNFALGNNLEMKRYSRSDTINHTKKIKLIDNLGLSTSYNMAADTLRWAPLSMNASTTLFNKINVSTNGTWDFYESDKYNSDYNTFYAKAHPNAPLRLKGMIFSVSTAFTADDFKSEDEKKNKAARDKARKQMIDDPDAYVDFYAPWRFNIGYSLALNKLKSATTFKDTIVITNILNFGGEINLTDHWKVTTNSGWDFTRHTIANTQFSIYRNLHCWEMRFTWVPFGTYRSYSFTINAMASVLQDLKYTRRKDYYDY